MAHPDDLASDDRAFDDLMRIALDVMGGDDAPDMVLKRHIRPALKRLKITKRIGWHSFRHGFSNLLRVNGVDVKTAQELLRHSNPSTTMRIYQQTVTEERRSAQAVAFNALMGVGASEP